ncbi:MAG: CopG family transcriptional regulator [Polaromonas sp.]|jgi:predicted transcriptional regulator|nr:CopG family transcriptional regulator [Polaromonas sp.]MBK9340503.1 CopG family transcriptional regulator [Rhodoferax sp.]MBK7502515.1 CopG family transcriptional regulator [Polaromonas sp.]MBL0252270.1 CopG family transcriptional regulator [Polaromonas sp.]MBP6157352.1 CopG family transcriptional regulator [Polaromonas sp.]
MSMLTLRIDDKLDQQLNELAAITGKSKSDIARDALKSQVFLSRLEALRAKGVPLAQAQGILTDEDVFALIS